MCPGRSVWSLTYTIDGERHAERIPAQWAEAVEYRVDAGRELQEAIREVLVSSQCPVVSSGAAAREEDQKEQVSVSTPRPLWKYLARRLGFRFLSRLSRRWSEASADLRENVAWGVLFGCVCVTCVNLCHCVTVQPVEPFKNVTVGVVVETLKM